MAQTKTEKGVIISMKKKEDLITELKEATKQREEIHKKITHLIREIATIERIEKAIPEPKKKGKLFGDPLVEIEQ